MIETLKARPVQRPWGGRRLYDLCGWDGEHGLVGEAWIHEGKSPPAITLKWIDAQENLSVQNHPRRPGFSKREAWYFVEAPSDGRIITGMDCPLDEPNPEPCLRYTPVRAGEMLELPAGCVHALTPGSLVLEVQEPTDCTYRIYDWGRGREVHIAEAKEAYCGDDPILHRPNSAPGRNPVIDRTEFTVECWQGPCVLRASIAGILGFVAGARLGACLRLGAGDEIELAGGERALWSFTAKRE